MTLKEQISWCKNQIKQGYEVIAITSILTRLKTLEKKEPPHPYHNEAVAEYKAFLARYKLPPVFDNRQGKPLREILYQLEKISFDQTPESALKSFKYILDNWDKTGEYLFKKKTVFAIKDNLLEIIDEIKNGKKHIGNIKNNHHADGRKEFGKL